MAQCPASFRQASHDLVSRGLTGWLLATWLLWPTGARAQADQVASHHVESLAGAFVKNDGQWPEVARFVARLGPVIVRAERGGLVLQAGGLRADGHAVESVVRLSFEGALSCEEPQADGEALPGVCNFLLGTDRAAWRTQVPRFDQVAYGTPNTGRIVISRAGGGLGIRVEGLPSPDAGRRIATLRLEGITELGPAAGKDLMASTATGSLRLATRAASGADACELRIVSGDCIAVLRSEGGETADVVADLQVEWSTYLGGESMGEYVYELEVDASGRTIAAGETRSMDFPTTPGAYDATWNGGGGTFPHDAWVSCLSADGSTLVFSTYLGGSGNEDVEGLALRPSGNIITEALPPRIVLGGSTTSTNFPTTPGGLKTSSIGGDVFVCELSSDGSALNFSTFLGGDLGLAGDLLADIDVAPDGRIVTTGITVTPDFPTTPNAFDSTFAGPSTAFDAFVAVLDPTLSQLLYGTYLGGVSDDRAQAVAIRDDGLIAVSGTAAPDFPVTPGTFDTNPPAVGKRKAFASLLDPVSGQLIWSTFLGTATPQRMRSRWDGTFIIAGYTNHTDLGNTGFPTTPGAFDTTYAGSDDGFVMHLNESGTALIYSTFLGGSSIERLYDLAVDSAGRATVVGNTQSPDQPTTPGALLTQQPNPGGNDIFVSRLDETGSKLLYSTFLGGPAADGSFDDAVALDGELAATVGGASDGLFPVTAGAYDPGEPVVFDATISRLTMLPDGAVKHGASTPGTNGPLAIGVTSMPKLGAADFALTCVGAPPGSTQGLLALGTAGLRSPLHVKGADLWLEPSRITVMVPVAANADGYSVFPAPLPAAPALVGQTTWWQYFWKPPAAVGPWWASNALEVTFQP